MFYSGCSGFEQEFEEIPVISQARKEHCAAETYIYYGQIMLWQGRMPEEHAHTDHYKNDQIAFPGLKSENADLALL